MKKKLISLLLFSMLFTPFAAAEKVNYSKFESPSEAFDEGYRDYIYQLYDYYSPDMTEQERDLHVELYEKFFEEFRGGNWYADEEEDVEILQAAYMDGESTANRDFQIISETIARTRDEFYETAYNDGMYDATYGEKRSEAQDERLYENGYHDGYREAKEKMTDSFEYKIGVGVIFIVLFGAAVFLFYQIRNAIQRKFKH